MAYWAKCQTWATPSEMHFDTEVPSKPLQKRADDLLMREIFHEQHDLTHQSPLSGCVLRWVVSAVARRAQDRSQPGAPMVPSRGMTRYGFVPQLAEQQATSRPARDRATAASAW